MTIKFAGAFEQLYILLLHAGIVGDWRPEPNGVFMLRCNEGGNLHWASGSKSIWVDGPAEAADRLRQRVAEALQSKVNKKLPEL